MPYTITPICNYRLYYANLYGDLTADDWASMSFLLNEAVQMTSHTKPFHVIEDMREVTQYPTDLYTIRETSIWAKSPELGWTICLTTNPVIAGIGRMVLSAHMKYYKQLTTLEQAAVFLSQVDPTLDTDNLVETAGNT